MGQAVVGEVDQVGRHLLLGRRAALEPPLADLGDHADQCLAVQLGQRRIGAAVAERGWSVQVFDEKLEGLLGEVPVDPGQAVLEKINTSDVAPPAFYLVVVEDAVEECEGFSGAWPVGFVRAGGAQGGTATESTPPAPQG